jgi:glycine oxidase
MQPSTLILGAGVSGLSTAWALLGRGHAVTLIERGVAGGESSWAGGGILSPLLPWDYPPAVTTLALAAMAMYPAWVEAIEATAGRAAEYWRSGMMATGIGDLDAAHRWCAAHGLGAQPRAWAGEAGLWLPDIAQVRNPRLVAALRAALLRAGVSLVEHCAATAVRSAGGRVTAVQTTVGEFAADSVVLATGAWAGLGLAGLPAAPHIRPVRGQMLLFRIAPGTPETIVYRQGLYVIPRRDGHVLVGSTIEDAGFDKTTDAQTARHLHEAAARLVPALASAQPVRHWAGLRPGSPANIPIVDRHPDFDNVFVNAGHFRYGVTMAPASAALLADLMTGAPPALDVAPYRWQAALGRSW